MKYAINGFFIILTLLFVLPLLLIVSISFSSEQSLLQHGYLLVPKEVSLEAYGVIMQQPMQLLNAYGVTFTVTLIGGGVGLLFSSMLAYTLSRKEYAYRRFTILYVIIPMLFNGGLVPFYIVATQYLQLKDTLAILILPYLISSFYILILKGFLDKLPGEIFDSAKIDGANEWRIYYQIVMPISTPALATIGLFIAFKYWNDWWLGLLFVDSQQLVPLQLMLYRLMSTIEYLKNTMNLTTIQIDLSRFPNLSARMAMAVLAAGPMMFIFPFFQRYFVAGLTVGSVKN